MAAITAERIETGTKGLNTFFEISPLNNVSPIFRVTTKSTVLLHICVHSVQECWREAICTWSIGVEIGKVATRFDVKSGFVSKTDPDLGEIFFNVLFCTVAWNGGGVNESGSGITTDPDFGETFFNVLLCTVAWNGGGGEAEGRLSASATTFCGPGTCLKSVVNSEMYAIWRTCRADQSGETRFIA
jgi:hypothetical protein